MPSSENSIALHVIALEAERLSLMKALRNPFLSPNEKIVSVILAQAYATTDPDPSGQPEPAFRRITISGPSGIAALVNISRRSAGSIVSRLLALDLFERHDVQEGHGADARTVSFFRFPDTLTMSYQAIAAVQAPTSKKAPKPKPVAPSCPTCGSPLTKKHAHAAQKLRT